MQHRGRYRAGDSRAALVARRPRRADDRQFRRRSSRPSGDAFPAHRSRGGPRAAVRGADVRPASARILRAPARAAAACIIAARTSSSAFASLGVARTIIARFDQRLASLSPDDIHRREVLVRRLDVRWVLVGEDFRFGKGRAGDIATLRAAARRRSASRRCAPCRSRTSVRRRPRSAVRLRPATSRMPPRCSAARSRWPDASRMARSSAARWASRPPTFA